MIKIAFIGAGSTTFARTLMTDVLSYPELADSHLALMDVDDRRLRRTADVGETILEEAGLEATITATTDRREALDGADYVLNMIHVGGVEPFRNEIEIPAKYGVGQAVGDTLGPGGVFRAARTAPTVLEIARDMEDVCPDALLINYTNPMAILCWAVDEATGVDVVGLCHSVQHTADVLAEYADVPREQLEYWVAGINHMAWFLELEREGEDLYPRLYEAMRDPDVYEKDSVRFDLMRHFGAFVTESSHHTSEYVPYFRTDPAEIEARTVDPDEEKESNFTIEWMPTGEYFRHWRDKREVDPDVNPGDLVPLERSDDYGSRIVHSTETGRPRRMNLNVRNDGGAIANLPSDACVEVPCLVDGTGIHPCAVGELPEQLAALNRTNVNVQERAVAAVLDRDETALRQAVKLDPLTAAELTLSEIDAMVDDLLDANAEYLPRFE